MNKILSISLFILSATMFFSCDKNRVCIDSTLIDDSISCIEIYDPVCGCDGNTYDNYCYAEKSGVTSYVAGKCCD